MVADLPRILTDLDLLWVQEKCECRAGKPGILFRAENTRIPISELPAPDRDLVGSIVELWSELGQGVFVLHGGRV